MNASSWQSFFNKIVSTFASNQPHKLTFTELVLFGLSNIIGSGLFVALQSSLVYGGNMSIYALLLMFISTIITGYTYVELFERYNSPITEYLSVKDSLGPMFGHIVAYLLYFFGILFFTTIIMYVTQYMWNLFAPSSIAHKFWGQPLLSTLLISIICFLLYEGIQNSRYISYFISVLLIAVILGVVFLSFPQYSYSSVFVKPPTPSVDNFILSCIMTLFLFNGYDFIIKVKEETEKSEYTSKALILCMSLSALAYFLIFISCFSVLKYSGISKINGDLITRMYSVLENKKVSMVVYVISAVIMFNASLLTVMSSSGFLTAMGKQNEIPFKDFFEKPENAVIFTGLVGSIITLIHSPTTVAIIANIMFILIILLMSTSLVIIRWNERKNKSNQTKYNYLKWINVDNIPLEVVMNILLLIYILYVIFRDRLWSCKK
jgi:amino acid transporter